jgi:hypothetical protein
MNTSSFLRRQAETCVVLSRATFDLTAAERLRTMAAELRAKAAELDEEPHDYRPESGERPARHRGWHPRDH